MRVKDVEEYIWDGVGIVLFLSIGWLFFLIGVAAEVFVNWLERTK